MTKSAAQRVMTNEQVKDFYFCHARKFTGGALELFQIICDRYESDKITNAAAPSVPTIGESISSLITGRLPHQFDAAPSTVKEVKREFSGCALAGKGTLVRGLYDKALDLAKRLEEAKHYWTLWYDECIESDAKNIRKDELLRELLPHLRAYGNHGIAGRIQRELDGKGG